MRWCPARGMLISMSRKTVNIIGVVLLVISCAAAVVFIVNTDGTDKKEAAKVDPYAFRNACSVLTAQAATSATGSKPSQSRMPDNKSKDFGTSYCTYTGPKGTVSLNISAGLNKNSLDYNKTFFTAQKPASAQDVKGYGDKAYWNPDNKSLNILKGNTVYTLTAPDLSQAKQVADSTKENM